ncbi:hypothetical protein O6H91_18G030700 [Diphasiastrum complanatum]|uniref:Uncharacterized protein n=1 Tax=Diphasiastrum complanatum TaxID=34168 RepID=A0ACC2AZE1_DIPCM|nr:hypothetical protein O6H91_18G030700 [Diphasiastrum complanatum]
MVMACGAAALFPLTTISLASSTATTSSLPIISASFCRLPHPQSPFCCIPTGATSIGGSSIRRRFLQLRASAAEEAEKHNVLVVNTNSGGHAFIGFWVAKEMRAAGHRVTVFTVGAETSEKMNKPPFSQFSLREIGVETVWGDPSSIGAKFGSNASFDIVLDNNGKDLEAVKPVADWANESGVGQFLFVSSAGIYKTSDELPHIEGDAVKADAGHVGVENYIGQLSFQSWASFRPQYMTGFGNNKDCEEWFFDRIVRGRPVPIPSPGLQLTNIAHVSDLSSMIALAIEKPKEAHGTIFNAVSDRAVTFDGLVRLCALAAGCEAKIIHYDPKALNIDAKKAFPFRNMHFYAEPRAAKEKLGWKSKTHLSEDLKARFQVYVTNGRHKKDIKFELDDKILDSMKVPVTI